MADDLRHPRDLSPNAIAARVAEILSAAENDAREIIEAARRGAPDVVPEPDMRESPSSGLEAAPRQHSSNGASSVAVEAPPPLGDIVRAVDALAARLDELEARIESRLDALAGRLAPEPSRSPVPHDSSQEEEPRPAAAGGEPVFESDVRVERVRAVELALRGFTREQIAAELRFTLPSQAIDTLLNEVLEGP